MLTAEIFHPLSACVPHREKERERMFGLGTTELIILAILFVLGLISLAIPYFAYRHGKKIGRLEALAERSERLASSAPHPPTSPD